LKRLGKTTQNRQDEKAVESIKKMVIHINVIVFENIVK